MAQAAASVYNLTREEGEFPVQAEMVQIAPFGRDMFDGQIMLEWAIFPDNGDSHTFRIKACDGSEVRRSGERLRKEMQDQLGPGFEVDVIYVR